MALFSQSKIYSQKRRKLCTSDYKVYISGSVLEGVQDS